MSTTTQSAARPGSRRPTALSVYGIASPLALGSELTLTVEAKCLDGTSAEGMGVLVLDECDAVVGSATLAPAPGRPQAQAAIAAPVPEKPGLYTWHVLLRPDAGRAAASRPVHFSVAPRADRRAVVSVRDSRSGEPIVGAAVFLYDTDEPRVKPLRATSDGRGVALASIASGAPYHVRVVASNYREADVDLGAGAADEPAEAQVEMLPGGYAAADMFG